jgi:hypothetical protein
MTATARSRAATNAGQLAVRRLAAALAVAAAGAAAAFAVVAPAAPAAAAGPCDRWAGTTGDDGNPGTEAAPFRSLARLAASLGPGQVGCLPAGQTYVATSGNGVIGGGPATADRPAVITSGPGGRARVQGQLWLRGESHDLTFTGLDLHGSYGPDGAPTGTKNTFLIVHGDRITFDGNDITNGRGICLGVGKGHGSSTDGNVLAEDVVITRNLIHGCGTDPDITWYAGDSGAHGVYLEYTQDAVVTQNLIYGNRYRGLQLWPRNDGAVVAHNLFDENATHVNIGSSEACGGSCRTTGAGFRSENTNVHHNVFSNRVTTWRQSQNPSQVYGYFLVGSPDHGNQVHDNCFAPGDATATGDGFRAYANTTAVVSYADRAARDYRMTAGSGCVGFGPASIQPGGQPDPEPEPEPQPVFRPDAQVRFGTRAWVGAGVHNTTGAGQRVSVTVRRGTTATFDVRVRNAGDVADAWAMAEAGPGGRAVARRWFTGGRDVTTDVDAGTLSFHHVAPGGFRTLRLTVRLGARAVVGSTAAWRLHAVHSPLADGVRDVVSITVRVAR